MLVLSRKREKQVFIEVPPSSEPRLIKLMVVDIRGDKVRIGFTADNCVKINREEIYDVIRKEASA